MTGQTIKTFHLLVLGLLPIPPVPCNWEPRKQLQRRLQRVSCLYTNTRAISYDAQLSKSNSRCYIFAVNVPAPTEASPQDANADGSSVQRGTVAPLLSVVNATSDQIAQEKGEILAKLTSLESAKRLRDVEVQAFLCVICRDISRAPCSSSPSILRQKCRVRTNSWMTRTLFVPCVVV